MNGMNGVRGHSPVRHGPGDWRCKCGTTLSGGPYGGGRAGARDVMHFHRLDLKYPGNVLTISRLTSTGNTRDDLGDPS